MTKYKYYFKKPKKEIAKDILVGIAAIGVLAVAASSPYFVLGVIRAVLKGDIHRPASARATFYRLKKEGCIRIKKKNRQIYISLTEKGRKRAGRFQINHLMIKKQKRWDKRWHIIFFDVTDKQRIKREALRGLLKRLGLYQLQKSVWIHPYEFRDEMGLLKDFFGFSSHEVRYVITGDIGDDTPLKKHFNLYYKL